MSPAELHFTAEELTSSGKARWHEGKETSVTGVFTDTRVSSPGALFIALAGEKFDAHNFLDKAVAAGAAALCIESTKAHLAPAGIPLLLTENTLEFYQNLANFHRCRFSKLKVFGITGSVGKTTAKEMTVKCLSSGKTMSFTKGNRNSQVGLPRTVLEVPEGTECAVFEMGMSLPGEMERIAVCAQPDIIMVINIIQN